jgi:hypothetical protein
MFIIGEQGPQRPDAVGVDDHALGDAGSTSTATQSVVSCSTTRARVSLSDPDSTAQISSAAPPIRNSAVAWRLKAAMHQMLLSYKWSVPAGYQIPID